MPRASALSITTSILLLSACHPAPDSKSADNAAVIATIPPSTLERAAIDAGVVTDAARLSPVGLFQRRHEAGRDSLCVVPANNKHFRFGIEAVFGTEEYCRGSGTARRAGDKLILQFSGRSDCIVVAQYDGDQLALPGVIDMKCAALCEGRGSLEGVSLPRLANDGATALAARDRTGNRLCAK